MGRHCFSFFPFLATPTFFIFCFLLFLVPIQSSAMFINNMLFHTSDAMCKVVRNNTFIGLHRAIVITRSLSHGVAQDAPHALDKLDLNLCNWIVHHKKCPSMGNVTMVTPKCLIFL